MPVYANHCYLWRIAASQQSNLGTHHGPQITVKDGGHVGHVDEGEHNPGKQGANQGGATRCAIRKCTLEMRSDTSAWWLCQTNATAESSRVY